MPAGSCGNSSNVRCRSTLSVERSRLLIPMIPAPSPTATSSSAPSWTSTSASRPSSRASAWSSPSVASIQRRDDQQDGVGARRERLVDLVGVDDEVLAQDRQRRRLPGRAQVVERAAEARPVGEDRERRCAAALVRGDDVLQAQRPPGSPRPTASDACARRSPTGLGAASAALNGRRSPAASRSAPRALELGQRRRRAAAADLVAGRDENRLEPFIAGASARVRSTNRSSAAAAAPESIAASAVRTPCSSESARPPA